MFARQHQYRSLFDLPQNHYDWVVVSPLISLMEDQVASLRKRGVNAAIVTSGGGVSNELCAIDNDLVTTQTSFAPSHL